MVHTKARKSCAQEQSIETNYIKFDIDQTGRSPFVGCVVQEMGL